MDPPVWDLTCEFWVECNCWMRQGLCHSEVYRNDFAVARRLGHDSHIFKYGFVTSEWFALSGNKCLTPGHANWISGRLSRGASICWSGRFLYHGVLWGGFGLLVVWEATRFLPPWMPNGRDWANSGQFLRNPPKLPLNLPPKLKKKLQFLPQVYISGAKNTLEKNSWSEFRYFWRSGGVRANGGSVLTKHLP